MVSLKFLLNLVVVSSRGITAYQFAQEACNEQLRSENHHCQRNVEVGRGGDQRGLDATADGNQFDGTNGDYSQEAEEEHDGTEKAKHVHRFQAEGAHKPQGEEVKISIDKAVQTTEFCFAEFASLVVDHLFSDFVETCILCQIGDVAVHLTVDFDVFHDINSVGLQAAVEVVQVLMPLTFRAVALKSLVGIVFESGS